MLTTREDRERFARDGYLIIRGLFSPEEVAILLADSGSERIQGASTKTYDGDAIGARLTYWHSIEATPWGAVSSDPRLVRTLSELLGHELAFFHGKIAFKDPGDGGGAFEWHQDYGYWYNQGFLFPDMGSAWVALDRATPVNSCLRVLRGSHRLGRLDHRGIGTQTGVVPERLECARRACDEVECAMDPGSALFFHANLLHASGPNRSPHRRRAFIVCYNRAGNPQIAGGREIQYPPCPIGDRGALRRFADLGRVSAAPALPSRSEEIT